VRGPLVAVLLGVVGCYVPDVGDCQYFCTTTCPSGLECVSGFCRVSGYDGACPCTVEADCGQPIVGEWGACEALEVCATVGERNRDVQTPRCVLEHCTIEPTVESETCARTTEGITCGADLPGAWSSCAYPTECAETGSQQRTVDAQICRSGTCVLESRQETMPCVRDTDGVTCDDGDACSPSTACAGGICTGFICAPCPC